jgi:hypothetical protein
MFSSTAWMRLIRQVSLLSPHKGDSRRESLGEMDFYHAVRFEGRYVFRDESTVGVAVGFGHEDRLCGDGVTATLEDGFLILQRYRFRASVEYAHGFLLIGLSRDAIAGNPRGARERDAGCRNFAAAFPMIGERFASGPATDSVGIGLAGPGSGLFPRLLREFLHWIDPMVLHSAGLLWPAKLAGADK